MSVVRSQPWPRAVNIYSGVQGFVVRQFVHEGQLIKKKGDPVYLIDVSKSTRSGIVTDNHRRDIENQLVRVDNIISRLEESKKNNAGYPWKNNVCNTQMRFVAHQILYSVQRKG